MKLTKSLADISEAMDSIWEEREMRKSRPVRMSVIVCNPNGKNKGFDLKEYNRRANGMK